MRYTFGGSVADFVVRPVTVGEVTGVVQFASATIALWNAQTDGTQHTDLQDMAGGAIASVTADGTGTIPQFKGPDGVISMWASADGGPRVQMLATDVSADLKTQVASHTTQLANIAAGQSAIDTVARDSAAGALSAANTAQARADAAYTLAESATSNTVVDQTARDAAASATATANGAATTANEAKTAAAQAQNTANQALIDNSSHGALTGLDQDDHPQYHTDARGDARYPSKADLASAGTDAATANTIVRRDASGRSKVAAPSATGDIANKAYVDGIGTATATPSTVARRDSSGRLQAVDPAVAADVATRGWVLAQNFGSNATPAVPFAPMSFSGDLAVQANPDYWLKNSTGGEQTVTGLDAQLDVAPTGSAATFRLFVEGTGVVGDACTVAAGSYGQTVTFATPVTIAANARVGVVVSAVGSTVAGARATVQLLGDPNIGSGGSGGLEVQDEGTVLGTASSLNFVGAAVSTSYSAGRATVTISSSGGGGSAGITFGMPGSGATFVADNSAGAEIALNQAFQAAGKRGGVKVLPGQYSPKGPIVLSREQTLEGSGAHCTFFTAAVGWSGAAMVMNNFAESDSVRHRVYGIGLDCANRAPRGTYFGIDATTPAVWSPDPAVDFDSLFITNATGNGMDFGGAYPGGMRESRIHNCRFQHCGGWSVYLKASDSVISHCTSQGSAGGGYYLAEGNCRSVGNKVYSTGAVGALAPGIRAVARATIAACEVQDCLGNGIELWGADINVSGCTLDSNGDGVADTGSCGVWVSSGALAPKIDVKSYHRSGGGATWKKAGAGQRYAIGFQLNGSTAKVLAVVGTGSYTGAPWQGNVYQAAGPNSSVTVI